MGKFVILVDAMNVFVEMPGDMLHLAVARC